MKEKIKKTCPVVKMTKSKSFSTTGIIPYFFTLIILVGLFSVQDTVNAQTTGPLGTCTTTGDFVTEATCTAGGGKWTPDTIMGTCTIVFAFKENKVYASTHSECNRVAGKWSSETAPSDTPVVAPANTDSALYSNMSNCYIYNVDDCLVVVFYFLFYVIPSFLLNLVANFFNVIIALALSSAMFGEKFIASSWEIVRDLSNIFFILVLLYVAIKLILGLGGHDTKKMIVQVIIMALLINFSMFFTKIIIDSSNILALVFYNKINVETKLDGEKRLYAPVLSSALGVQEKDVSGGLVSQFDPTKFLTEEFFQKVRERPAVIPTIGSSGSALGAATYIGSGALIGSFVPVIGTGIGAVIGGVAYGLSFLGSPEVPPGLMIGIILTAGLIMIFATYAFFMAAVSFLGRLIELWVLIIFSPFAFMSSTIPLLGHIEYIGWDSWLKRLLKVSFMAPIFMFFMYLIFKIIENPIWEELTVRKPEEQGMVEAMILVLLPALIILTLLLKATKYAKEASGEVGGMILKGASLATGLLVGGGLGLAAKTLQGTVGHVGKNVAESETAKGLATSENVVGRWLGRNIQSAGMKAAGSSFDARKGALGAGLGVISSATGLKLNSGLVSVEAGGYLADVDGRNNARKKRAETLKGASSAKAKQELRDAEVALHSLAEVNSHAIEEKDRLIKGFEAKRDRYEKQKNSNPEDKDAADKFKEFAAKVTQLTNERSAIKNARATDVSAAKDAAEAAKNAAIEAKEAVDIAKKKLEADPKNDTLIKEADKADSVLGDLMQKLAVANAAHASAKIGGKSQNDYEDDILPEKKREVHKAEHHAAEGYARSIYSEESKVDKWRNKIQFWSQGERKRSAQDVRTNVKPEKQSSGGGHSILPHILGSGLVSAASDHGHSEQPSSTSTTKADTHSTKS